MARVQRIGEPPGDDPAQTPFSSYRTTISGELIDYNGHLNDSAYARLLSDANELFFDALDLGEGYRRRTGCAVFTVETHIRFIREVTEGDVVLAHTLLVAHDDKRLRLHTSLLADGEIAVATGESLYVHVGREGRVGEFSAEVAAALALVQLGHDASPRPDHLGAGINVPALRDDSVRSRRS